jgi:energy-coupling factor transporter ATP-binding protein EcfA2
VIQQVGLENEALSLARTLPHGDQRKLELGIILAADPEVLLLDEPTAGMAAEQVPELIDLIRRCMPDGNKTILLVEHNMNVVMSISDRITVMHQGRCWPRARRPRSPLTKSCRAPTWAGCTISIRQGRHDGQRASFRSARHPHLHRPVPHPAGGDGRRAAGSIVALLGRNGAGKTTTLKSILGLTAAPPGPDPVERPRDPGPAQL